MLGVVAGDEVVATKIVVAGVGGSPRPGWSRPIRPGRQQPGSGAPTAGRTSGCAETSSSFQTAPRLSREERQVVPALHAGDAGGHRFEQFQTRLVPDGRAEVHVPRAAHGRLSRHLRGQDPGLSFMSHDRFVGVSVPICLSIDSHGLVDSGGRAPGARSRGPGRAARIQA